jgi:hypothetical protein
MSLLQRYLPRHDFAETHHITIAAPPAAVRLVGRFWEEGVQNFV